MNALVVFTGRSGLWTTRLFRRGFRHCFVAVLSDGYWIVLDGRAGRPELSVVAGDGDDLQGFYRDHGFVVVETHVEPRRSLQPFMLGTCVGASKRVLGISAPCILTPYQLWRYLERRRGRGR